MLKASIQTIFIPCRNKPIFLTSKSKLKPCEYFVNYGSFRLLPVLKINQNKLQRILIFGNDRKVKIDAKCPDLVNIKRINFQRTLQAHAQYNKFGGGSYHQARKIYINILILKTFIQSDRFLRGRTFKSRRNLLRITRILFGKDSIFKKERKKFKREERMKEQLYKYANIQLPNIIYLIVTLHSFLQLMDDCFYCLK